MSLDIEQLRWNVQHLTEGQRRARTSELLQQRSEARARNESLSHEQQALLNLLLDASAIPVRETVEEKKIHKQIERSLRGLNGNLEAYRKLEWKEPNLQEQNPST